MEGLLLCHAHFGWECLYCQCPSPTRSQKGQDYDKEERYCELQWRAAEG